MCLTWFNEPPHHFVLMWLLFVISKNLSIALSLYKGSLLGNLECVGLPFLSVSTFGIIILWLTVHSDRIELTKIEWAYSDGEYLKLNGLKELRDPICRAVCIIIMKVAMWLLLVLWNPLWEYVVPYVCALKAPGKVPRECVLSRSTLMCSSHLEDTIYTATQG